MLADAFNGRNLLAFATGRQQRARHHRHSIDQHRASATRGVVAPALGPSELQLLPQNVEQQRIRLNCKFVPAAIHAKFDEFFFH